VPVIREAIVAQEALAKRLSPGDYISVHWGIVCDKLSERAIKRLSYYTEQSIRLANETI
jgi:hydrogenase maturation factor